MLSLLLCVYCELMEQATNAGGGGGGGGGLGTRLKCLLFIRIPPVDVGYC